MKKYKLIKTVDVDNDYVIILAKKLPSIEKKCIECSYCKYIGDYSLCYCDKYRTVVDKNDVCIEVGM